MTEDDDPADIRERAQALREDLATEVEGPAEQDDHALARKQAEDEDEDEETA